MRWMCAKTCGVVVSAGLVLGSSALAESSLDFLHDGAVGCLHGRLGALTGFEERGLGLRYDETAGADQANYPPDRIVDYRHMRLEIDIPDMNTPRFDAVSALEVAAIGEPASALELHAEGLIIESVSLGSRGQGVSWSHDGSVLELAFSPPLEPDEKHTIRIEYAVEDPVDGLFWTPESEAWPDRPAQIHTQGQPETNRHWFPAHDFPNERLTTELLVTVPEGYLVSSNGELVTERTRGGRTTFHWRQTPEHVTYLVTLIIGKFDIVDVGTDDIPMPVYVPPGKADLVEQTYGRTAEMVEVFEDRFGVAYPWARYAQLVVWNFGAGGMENTAATTMYDTAILDERALEDADLDSLIAHELGHQWYGDLITCNSWAHIWLNEGFATYSSALWFEHRDGYEDGYLRSMHGTMRSAARRDSIDADSESGWKRPPMVSRLYEHPWDVFRRRSNPYSKGASVLHMLRRNLGEDIFFEAIRAYTRKHENTSTETSQLRAVLEEVSGLSLAQFFEQWTGRPGAPEVVVDIDWDESDKSLNLTIEQTQRIDEFLPAYVFDLPVWIESNGSWVQETIEVAGRRHERNISLPGEPTMVVVDPHLDVLMTLSVDQPATRFIEQLQRGPTIAARLDAAGALLGHAGSKTIAALKGVAMDSAVNHALRSEAIETLGDLEAVEALLEIAGAGVDDARPRRSLMAALAEAGGDEALEVLVRHAADADESYALQAAALRGVGEHGGDEHMDIVLDALHRDSQHEQVRSAALSALADLDQPEGLDAAIPFTRQGWLQRMRPAAIRAVASLAHHDEDKAFEAIAPLLRDSEWRASSAAGAALVAMEDERGVGTLRKVAATHRHPRFREQAGEWADRLAARLRRDDPDSAIRREVETLRRELEELRLRVEESKGPGA